MPVSPTSPAGSFEAWAGELERLARETSIHCKLSGLLTEAGERSSLVDLAPYVAHVFASFGPERVLWGSDWPVLNAVSAYARWLELSQGARRALRPRAGRRRAGE